MQYRDKQAQAHAQKLYYQKNAKKDLLLKFHQKRNGQK